MPLNVNYLGDSTTPTRGARIEGLTTILHTDEGDYQISLTLPTNMEEFAKFLCVTRSAMKSLMENEAMDREANQVG